VRELLEKGASVNVQCNAGWTPLHKACLKGYTDIVRLLCQHGARTDIGSTDEHDTPLHDACSNGHQDVILVLLEYGANPRAQNSQGTFPHEMVDDEMTELKKIVLDSTKTYKETKKESHEDREDSEPPISPAMKRHSRRTSTASDAPFQSTLGSSRPKRGAATAKDDLLARDITYRDSHRRGHLHLQASQGNNWFVKELLKMGASISPRDRDGNTPLHLAARGGYKDVVETLLLYGADVNAPSNQDETPLHEVAGRGHMEIVNMLLFWGANPTKKDSNGRTALDVAIESASTAAEGEIEMLRQKFVEFGGVPPEVEEDLNVKMEEIEEVPPVSDDVDREPTANGDLTSALPSPTLDPRISPINEVDEKSPELPVVNGNHEETTEDVKEREDLRERSTEAQPSIPAAADISEDVSAEKLQDMQIDEDETRRPTSGIHSSEGSPEPATEAKNTEKVSESLQNKMAETQPSVEETVSVEVLEEKPAMEEIITKEPSPLPESVPEPRWAELSALESLPELLKEEMSPLFPLYSMQFQGESQVYLAHIQVCCILGFTTKEFFAKCISVVVPI